MFKSSQISITPGRLLERPNIIMERPKSVALKDILAQPFKVPKLFSAHRPPSVDPRPITSKKPVQEDFPAFLTEYLNTKEPSFPSFPKKRKIFTHSSQKRSKTPSYSLDTETKIHEKIPSTSPMFTQEENHESHNIQMHRFYKPYVIKISPRAIIRLYSPLPIPNVNFERKKGIRRKKTRLLNSSAGESEKEGEKKAIPIIINKYTKSFAEKLQKVIEISEQAKEEVNLLYK